MEKHVFCIALYAVLVVLAILLSLFCIVWENANQDVTIAADGDSTYSIFIDSMDKGSLAAADYLANAIRVGTGASLPMATQRDGKSPLIEICCEEACADTDAAYAVALNWGTVRLTVYDEENIFPAVKAVSDRWISREGGLQDGTLTINRGMIRDALQDLPVQLAGQIRILTQNLRYADDPDGNSLDLRSMRFLLEMKEYGPDLIGTQEATAWWMDRMENQLSDEYGIVGCSRMGPDSTEEEWNAILYRKDRFDFLDGDTFWLSDTPELPATMLEYEGRVRICTWTLLRDRETGKEFLFCNTHLQNGAAKALGAVRARQLEILFEVLDKDLNYLDRFPGFLVGDFNGSEDELFYTVATAVYRDAADSAVKDASQVHYTFNGFGRESALLDYCFHSSGNTTILEYQILSKLYNGYVSDHYGVLVTALVN